MFLSRSGHNVTVLTRDNELVTKKRVSWGLRYEQLDNLNYILESIPTRISEGKLTYKDAKGNEKSIQADSVVLYE